MIAGIDAGAPVATADAGTHRERLLDTTDDPHAGQRARSYGAKARSHKTRTRTGA